MPKGTLTTSGEHDGGCTGEKRCTLGVECVCACRCVGTGVHRCVVCLSRKIEVFIVEGLYAPLLFVFSLK